MSKVRVLGKVKIYRGRMSGKTASKSRLLELGLTLDDTLFWELFNTYNIDYISSLTGYSKQQLYNKKRFLKNKIEKALKEAKENEC